MSSVWSIRVLGFTPGGDVDVKALAERIRSSPLFENSSVELSENGESIIVKLREAANWPDLSNSDSLRSEVRQAVDAMKELDSSSILDWSGGHDEWSELLPTQANFSRRDDIGDAHLEHLTTLNWWSNLKDVNLAGNGITDAGLEHLKELDGLEELDLSGTQITDAGLKHLQGLNRLRELNLAETEVTDAGVKMLEKVLPELHISRPEQPQPASKRLQPLAKHAPPAPESQRPKAQIEKPSGKITSDDDLDPETQVPISTCAELQAMRNDLAGHYVLVNDIDCSDFDFEPVGSQESPFTGTLDGQGFVISGLSIDRRSDDLVGLFRLARSARIRNVELSQPVVRGERGVGAVFGRVIGSTVRNVHVGDGRISGRDTIGGLAGSSDDSSLEQVSTSGVVRGNQDTSNDSPFFGGLIGYSVGTSLLRSHSSADVEGKNGWKIGGLVGQLSQGKVSECFSTGQVNGWARVGGLAGHIEGSSAVVSDCYARGDVKGTQQVGGFVGLTYQGPTITRNYATGAVTGGTDTGGFVGRVLGGTLSACFWDVSASGQSGDNARAGTTGLSTAEMQTAKSFKSAGWDFEDTWGLITNEDFAVRRQ